MYPKVWHVEERAIPSWALGLASRWLCFLFKVNLKVQKFLGSREVNKSWIHDVK